MRALWRRRNEHRDPRHLSVLDLGASAVKALVVPKQGQAVAEQEIIEFCKQNLAHYKSPKSVDFVDSLPRTGSGKIHKKSIRDGYWQVYEKKVH